LLKAKRKGFNYTLVKLDIEGNKPAEESLLYADKNCEKEIGYVTSAMWSPVVKANIALAMVNSTALKGDIWAEIYYSKELRHHSKIARCVIKEAPFWSPVRARATPPAAF
jgi:aminomethyltransferase